MTTKTKKAVAFHHEREGGVDWPVAAIAVDVQLLPPHEEHFDAYREMARRIVRIVSGRSTEADVADVQRYFNASEVRALMVALVKEVVDEGYVRQMPERFVCDECGQRGEGDIEDHYNDCEG